MTDNELIEVAIVGISHTTPYYDLDDEYTKQFLERFITNWEFVTKEQYALLLKYENMLGGILITRQPVRKVLTNTIPQIIEAAEKQAQRIKEADKKYKEEEKERALKKKQKALQRAKKKTEELEKELSKNK